MKERLKLLFCNIFFWLSIFIIQKPIFLLFQYPEAKRHSLFDLIGTITHGFSMDLSTVGYCTLFVVVLLVISCFIKGSRWIRRAVDAYTYVLIGVISLLFVADVFLYKYWGFRIDTTPLFYLKTPKDAMASGTWFEYIAAIITFTTIVWLSVRWYKYLIGKFTSEWGDTAFSAIVPLLLMGGILFVLIRGGVGVSTMNAGHVYFSNSTFLNHAAINPTWNFVNSCTRMSNFNQQYRFLDEPEATEIVKEMNNSDKEDKHYQVLNTTRPNIILIVMEGIGSNVIETLGGTADVAPNLCRYTKEGLCFTNFFASSFRTDRGLVAILSGYPGQPTNSLMKFPNKTQNTPILSQYLKKEGYETAFYYGGDDNFTNLHSYLVTGDYEIIVNEKNFDGKDMSTKWGAYDHVLLNKVKEDLPSAKKPYFKTILTLNSHEPFDVPSHVFDDPYLNSVHYADSCIGDFIEHFKSTDDWNNSLIVILPDHAFRYPNTMENEKPARYRIPLIWMGGAVVSSENITKTCSQVDLAATLLHQLELEACDFVFSKDILNTNYPEYAFYSFIDGFGLINKSDTVVYDCAAHRTLTQGSETTLKQGMAFLQKLYDDLAKR